jgi:hypothetical protein
LITVSAKAENPFSYRTIDGVGNNIANADWGSAGVPLLRLYEKTSYKQGWCTGPANLYTHYRHQLDDKISATQTGAIAESLRNSDAVWQSMRKDNRSRK